MQTPGVYEYQTPAQTAYPQTPGVMAGTGYSGSESQFGKWLRLDKLVEIELIPL